MAEVLLVAQGPDSGKWPSVRSVCVKKSVLGPLLFLVYINDMTEACKCNLFVYADDSALVVADKNLAQLQERLSEQLTNIGLWLSDNKLSLQLGKTINSVWLQTQIKQS